MNKLQNMDILREHELLALLGIVELLRKTGQSFTIINHAFEEYKEMCKQYSITPHNKTSLRRHLHQLIQMNLITLRPKKDERFLEITLSGDNLNKLLRKKNCEVKKYLGLQNFYFC